MMLFWGQGFLRGLVRFLLLVLVVLFCWGWLTHVVLGRMTTRQYIQKICADCQNYITGQKDKIQKTTTRVTGVVKEWGGPVVV